MQSVESIGTTKRGELLLDLRTLGLEFLEEYGCLWGAWDAVSMRRVGRQAAEPLDEKSVSLEQSLELRVPAERFIRCDDTKCRARRRARR